MTTSPTTILLTALTVWLAATLAIATTQLERRAVRGDHGHAAFVLDATSTD